MKKKLIVSIFVLVILASAIIAEPLSDRIDSINNWMKDKFKSKFTDKEDKDIKDVEIEQEQGRIKILKTEIDGHEWRIITVHG